METAEDVDRKRAEKQARKQAKKQAKKQEKRRLAVDEEYEKLDEYHIDRGRVGFIDNNQKRQGGFGVVRQAHLYTSAYLPTWVASHLYGEPQLVAVKQITVPPMQDTWDLKRAFTKEVLIWSRVKGHPGISKFIGFCADFDRREAWLISPWEPYGNVSEFIKGRELEVPEKLSLAYDTLDALEFLHKLNPPVCHGDIKSANVLVNVEYRAVLCDFGLARLYEDIGFGRLESTAAMNKGSIRWCSPELFEGHPRTASSDIYAWGWLVWEIMTGELPYEESKTDYAIMRKIFEGPVGQVNGESRLRDFLQLWDLMARCWAADPPQRPTTAMCKTTFDYLPHCLPIPRNGDPHARSAALLENLGDLESWKGNHKAGLDYLEQALRLYEEERNDNGIASVLRKQAEVAYRDSNFAKRNVVAPAALEKCRSLQDDLGVADALYWVSYGEKYVKDAIPHLEESLKIFRVKGKSVGVAKCLQRLGELYRSQENYSKALSVLEEAIDVASRCGDRLGEANALNILGTTHHCLDHMDQAISTFQRAKDITRSIGWEPGLITCLCRLGEVKLEQGLHAEAEEVLRESVRIARRSDVGWRLGQALDDLGECFRAQGRHEEAISALEESYLIGQNIGQVFDSELANTAAHLADSKSTLGHKQEALTWYDRAIAEWRKGEEEEDEIATCIAAKDAILADMKRRDEEALHGEASS